MCFVTRCANVGTVGKVKHRDGWRKVGELAKCVRDGWRTVGMIRGFKHCEHTQH